MDPAVSKLRRSASSHASRISAYSRHLGELDSEAQRSRGHRRLLDSKFRHCSACTGQGGVSARRAPCELDAFLGAVGTTE